MQMTINAPLPNIHVRGRICTIALHLVVERGVARLCTNTATKVTNKAFGHALTSPHFRRAQHDAEEPANHDALEPRVFLPRQ